MTVKIAPMAWSLTCPHCHEEMPTASGSLMWTAEDFAHDDHVLPKQIQCRRCRALSRLPVALHPLART